MTMLFAEAFPLESRLISVEAVAADATPLPVGSPVRTGVVIVGEADITNVVPVPVCEVMAVALPVEVIGPVRLAFVVTLPAVNPAAVPVKLVAVPDAGVPRGPPE